MRLAKVNDLSIFLSRLYPRVFESQTPKGYMGLVKIKGGGLTGLPCKQQKKLERHNAETFKRKKGKPNKP